MKGFEKILRCKLANLSEKKERKVSANDDFSIVDDKVVARIWWSKKVRLFQRR